MVVWGSFGFSERGTAASDLVLPCCFVYVFLVLAVENFVFLIVVLMNITVAPIKFLIVK